MKSNLKQLLKQPRNQWGLFLIFLVFIGTPLGILTIFNIEPNFIKWFLFWVGVGITDMILEALIFQPQDTEE